VAKVAKKPKSADDDDDFDNFEEISDDEVSYGDDIESGRSSSMQPSHRLAIRRAIELAREERALQRELEDYPD